MRLLLDTSVFLWWIDHPPKLSKPARAAVSDPENQVFLSIVSPWEIAIKSSVGKLRTPGNIAAILPTMGIELLSLSLAHVAAVEILPFHHRDPFDRMLAAQAQAEGAKLVTSDAVFARYGIATLW